MLGSRDPKLYATPTPSRRSGRPSRPGWRLPAQTVRVDRFGEHLRGQPPPVQLTHRGGDMNADPVGIGVVPPVDDKPHPQVTGSGGPR